MTRALLRSFILLLTIGLAGQATAQCISIAGCAVPVDRSLNVDTLDCGQVDSIIADPVSSLLFADFNDGTIPVGWTDNSSAQFDNPCEPSPDGSTHLWMGPAIDQPRFMQTVNFDLSTYSGGQICFEFDMAQQVDAAPCEGPDEPDEGVFLQYSTDDGTTWNNIFYFNPDTVCCGCPAGGCGGAAPSPFITWDSYCFNIPPSAFDTCTSIRWYQDFTSGNDFDHWGLDNVSISVTGGGGSGGGTYELAWLNDTTDTDSLFIFDATGFVGDTTVSVIYTNNIDDTCRTDINYYVRPTDAGPDIIAACDDGLGEPLQVTGATTVVWSPDYELDDIFSTNPITTTLVDTSYIVQSFCDQDTVGVDVVGTITPDALTSSGTDVDTICLFGSTNLTVTADLPIDSVVWSPDIELSATDQTSVFASPLADQMYTVEVWSAGGCNKLDTVMVFVGPPQPFVDATEDTTICAGETVPLNASAISAGGVITCDFPTSLSLGDDQLSSAITLPFSFDFFGNTFTDVFISSNGFLTFDSGSGSDLGNSALPTNTTFGARDFVALAWDDLDPGGGAGTIEWCVQGTAPNRQFVVTFTDVPHFPGPAGPTVTVQAVLYETSNVVQINNIDINNDGLGMTQGIGNSDGTLGVGPAAYNNTAFTAVNESWLYIPTSDTTYDLINTGGGGSGTPSTFDFNWTAITGSTADLSDPTIADPVFSGTSTSTYVVEITPTGTDCSAFDTVTVTVTPDFSFTLTASDDTICRNQTSVLTVSPDATYPGYDVTWSPDDNSLDTINGLSVNATPDNTTTYTATIQAVGGCINIDSIDLIVAGEAPPPVTFSDVDPICDGTPASVTATLGQGETITDDFEGAGCFDPTVWASVTNGDCLGDCGTPSGSGSALHFDGTGTPGVNRVAQTVPIDASAGGSITFDMIFGSAFGSCENADAGEDVELQFSTDGGATWTTIALYDNDVITTWTSITETIPPAAQTSSTIFRWTQIQFSSCTNCDEWAIDNVEIDAGCFGPSCGNFDYLWYPNDFDITNPTDSSTLLAPSSSKWFFLDVTTAGTDCSITDSIFIRVNELVYDISPDAEICEGDSAEIWIDAGANVTYTWTPAAGLTDPSADTTDAFPTTDTWFVVQMDSLAGCSDEDSVLVTIDQPEQVPIVPSDFDLTVCPDSTLTLGVGPSYESYEWFPGGITDPTITAGPGSYWATLTSALGCEDFTDTVTVTEAVINQLTGWGSDTAFCAGGSTVLSAPDTLSDVNWFSNGTPVGSGTDLTVSSNGNFSFTFRTDQGCLNTSDAVEVTVNPLPVLDMSNFGNPVLCCSEDSLVKNIASAIVSPALSDVTGVFWNGQAITPIEPLMNVPLDLGVDSFRIVDANGCAQSDTFRTERFCADPVIDGDTLIAVDDNGSMDLVHDTYGPNDSTTYQWLPGLFPDPTSQNQIFTSSTPGTFDFTAYVTTNAGDPGFQCIDTAVHTIEVFYPVVPATFPAAFTPNNDGLNDVFGPTVTAGLVTITDFRIYNSWGEEVYDVGDDTPWDGTAAGVDQPAGTYVYYITVEYADGSTETFAGSVSLIR